MFCGSECIYWDSWSDVIKVIVLYGGDKLNRLSTFNFEEDALLRSGAHWEIDRWLKKGMPFVWILTKIIMLNYSLKYIGLIVIVFMVILLFRLNPGHFQVSKWEEIALNIV